MDIAGLSRQWVWCKNTEHAFSNHQLSYPYTVPKFLFQRYNAEQPVEHFCAPPFLTRKRIVIRYMRQFGLRSALRLFSHQTICTFIAARFNYSLVEWSTCFVALFWPFKVTFVLNESIATGSCWKWKKSWRFPKADRVNICVQPSWCCLVASHGAIWSDSSTIHISSS